MPCLQAKPQSHKVTRLSMPSIGQSHKEFQILPACGRWRHHQTKLAWEMCRGPKCEALLCIALSICYLKIEPFMAFYKSSALLFLHETSWNTSFRVSSRAQDQSSNWFFCYVLRFHAEALAGYQVPEADLPGAFRIETWKLWKTLARKRKKARAPTTKPMARNIL